MRLLTIARMSVWSSVAGSLALFASMQPELQKIFIFLKDLDYEAISKFWNGISALLVGGGAIGIRQVIAVDKRLNGKWYWVAKVVDLDGDKLIRVSQGFTVISDIGDWKKRLESPQAVLHGSAIEANGETLKKNAFHATEISVARDGMLFYEWTYVDDKFATGWTRLQWQPIDTKRGIFRKSSIRVFGRFCMASSYGAGSIEFFYRKSDAELEYQNSLLLLSSDRSDAAAPP